MVSRGAHRYVSGEGWEGGALPKGGGGSAKKKKKKLGRRGGGPAQKKKKINNNNILFFLIFFFFFLGGPPPPPPLPPPLLRARFACVGSWCHPTECGEVYRLAESNTKRVDIVYQY